MKATVSSRINGIIKNGNFSLAENFKSLAFIARKKSKIFENICFELTTQFGPIIASTSWINSVISDYHIIKEPECYYCQL